MAHINIACRNAQLAAFASRFTDAVLTIYSGTVPANSDASLGAAVALVAHDFAGFGTPSAGSVVASAIANEVITTSGTASFARITDGTEVVQLTIGLSGSGADVIADTLTYTSGQDSIIVSVTVGQVA